MLKILKKEKAPKVQMTDEVKQMAKIFSLNIKEAGNIKELGNIKEAGNIKKLRKYQKYGLVVLSLLLSLSAIPVKAQLQVTVTGGNFNPIPIAVTDFLAGDTMGQQISEVVAADLERSGLFNPLDKASFLERISNPDIEPRFSDWQQIKAQGLVTGRVNKELDGRLCVKFHLWDVYSNKWLDGREFCADQQSYRRIAHMIADVVYSKMTGEKGYFDTRIVFIDETGPKDKRIKRLAIMDQDGANVSFLSNGSELVLTPRFSPSNQEITYMAYLGNNVPKVYLQQIELGQRQLVGSFPNMTISPRFSPDGKKIIMSLLQDNGSSNLYVMDLGAPNNIVRLTTTRAIDTSASYSPDGSQIVFESDRGGRQQLYVMDANGQNQKRISFGDGSYSTPVWSPRGDYIAFTKLTKGQFAIGVMKPDGQGERILTSGFHNEGPTWAPNGRVIMFFRQNQGSGPKIYTIDISGRNERQLPTPNDASDPAWSPLLN